MDTKENLTFTVSPTDGPKWVAIDSQNTIISEGKTPTEVIEKSKSISDDFILMFVPQEDTTYIF